MDSIASKTEPLAVADSEPKRENVYKIIAHLNDYNHSFSNIKVEGTNIEVFK